MNRPDLLLAPKIQKGVIGTNVSTVTSSVLNELRLEGQFCDVVINVDGVEFKAHKNILCGCSSYFRALFTGDWTPRVKQTYHIPGVSVEMMRLIVEYAYTGCSAVTEENAEDLLAAADQFSVMGLVGACCDFLKSRLAPENCVGIWRLTDTCFYPDLRGQAYGYILCHFEQVVEISDEFLALSAAQLAEVIEVDELNVSHEEVVFEAVVDWVDHMPEERAALVAMLLSKVRLALMSEDFLAGRVANHALVRASEECRATVAEALAAMRGLNADGHFAWDLSNPMTRPRLPHAVLLATGGWSGNAPTNAIEAYDVRADRWVAVPQEGRSSPRAYHGAVHLGGFVYCVGGFDGVDYFNSTWRFDPVARNWRQAAPMHSRRCYVSVATLGGCVYAMGGYDGHLRVFTAECYEPETNQWTLIAPMQVQRSDAGATTLHGQVYICGGFNGTFCLSSAESYSPETNRWTMIAAMGDRRSGVGVITYREQVYVVGGFDGTRRLCTAEAYNPLSNTWRAVCSMAIPRSNFGIEVIDDMLFVAGGFNGVTTEFKVEFYDENTDRWYYAQNMGLHRSALSCCVVSGLPNVSAYTLSRDAAPGSARENAVEEDEEAEDEEEEEEEEEDEEDEEAEEEEEEEEEEEALA